MESPKNFLYRKPIKKEAQRLTTGEIHKILQYVAKNRKNQAMILLLLTTGLRLSELCSLQKQQFKKAILIGNVYQINVLGKGKKLRSIFLPITTRNCCTSLKSKGSSVLGMKKATVQYRISRIRNATHIKFSAHTLRHTYLSYLASQGADVYKIQKIAGHASLTTTSLYLHCSNKELADTAGLVCNLME
ncbi:MAG: site-specific integrase [Candidatus Peribacteria bacterium]|nr:site-specific integrase [Candidatus Peribacteria bacterium]